MSNFIPNFHFCPPAEKLLWPWCDKAKCWHWDQSGLRNYSLLWGKKIDEIESFASGNFDTDFSKRQFKSWRRDWNKRNANGGVYMPPMDDDDFDPVGVLPPKIDAAVAHIQKQSMDVSAKCLDALAYKRKKEDLEFLRAKPEMEDFMQEFYDEMSLGKVDMGGTKYSSVPYYALPFGLDYTNDDEFRLFAEFLYNLGAEAAFKTILKAWADVKNLQQIRLLNSHDQYKYGVHVVDSIDDAVTGLPGAEYVFPGELLTDRSNLPDYSDNTVRARRITCKALELFNRFPAEICSREQLERIINCTTSGPERGYGPCNGRNTPVAQGDFNTFNVNLIKFQVKTVDNAMVAEKETDYGVLRTVTGKVEECKDKVWAQNTIEFYWLENTKYYFGINRLPFAYRDKGSEIYSGFTTCIYKSKKKSAVELAIPENKMMQICIDKIKHIIKMSTPPGKKIDIAGLIFANEGLKDTKDSYTVARLMEMALQDNVHIWDSRGFEGKQNNRPDNVIDVPGGVKDELKGYYLAYDRARRAIDEYTSITPQITGQQVRDEGLGLNELLYQNSLAGLNYVNDAILDSYKKLFNIWATYFKQAVEKGGKPRKTIEKIIGENNVELIDKLDDIRLHDMGVTIRLGKPAEEQELFKRSVLDMKNKGVITSYDEWLIFNVLDPWDAMILLGVKENKFRREAKEEAAANREALIKREQEVGKNMMQQTQMMGQMEAQKMQLQAQIDAQYEQLMLQLGLQKEAFTWRLKDAFQQRKSDQQRNNKNSNMAYKSILEQQKAAGGIA